LNLALYTRPMGGPDGSDGLAESPYTWAKGFYHWPFRHLSGFSLNQG